MATPKFQLPKMDKKVMVGIAAAAIVVIGGAAVALRGGGGAKPGKYTWEFAAVEKGTVSRVVSASGAVQPKERVDVGSEVSGKIVEVKVDFNDKVKKGQVMAIVDPETFLNTLQQNRARLDQSRASVENGRASIDRARLQLDIQLKAYNRTKALYAEGAASTQQMEQAEQSWKNAVIALQTEEVSLKSSQAGLKTAEATVQDSVTRLERTNIRSPLDGVVINRKLEVGQTVQSSQAIATLFVVAADLSEIEIEAAVVESDIGGVDNGDPAFFTVDAFPGERFNGVVSQVRKLGAEQANVVTYTVVVNARNPNGKLLPGMTANVEITADRAENVLRIAEGATKYQPPKEIQDQLRERYMGQGGPNGQGGPQGQGGNRNGQGGQGGQQVAMGGQGGGNFGGGGQGGNRNGGGGGNFGGGGQGGNRGGMGGMMGGGGNNMMTEWLTAAGVDEARVKKITDEFTAERERIMASMPRPPQQQGGVLGGGQNFGPPQNMQMQQQMNEMRSKMQAAQDGVLKRNLNDTEFTAVAKHRAEMQSQKRVTAFKVNDKGELEPHQLTVGLSDGSFAQIIRGAEEGDKFVIRATAAGAKDKK